jgi:hypothetical protein
MSSRNSLVQDTIADLKRRKQMMFGTEHLVEDMSRRYEADSLCSIALNENIMSHNLIRERSTLNVTKENEKYLVLHIDGSFLNHS